MAPGSREVIGGLWGDSAWGYLHIELLVVPEAMRGTGIGRTLLQRAEEEALCRGCHQVWLDTFSFQARGFYEKLGYSVFGTLEDYRVGHSRMFLRKTIAPAASSAL
ncbi:GNAT family N-acetyltransferase [Lichenicoccus roseus]|uniref:GNAT family N-acetyltransferase n=1 Tax=Lichenicoccus roseus TaxID=2683649 RepID=A0A5R9J4D3_9PROT|nr:GNAT family N-acetyltransferase [Lichenicoccus roseus]TLU70471.1 GNAT family N-acetyltransferase [Lichenicoccus roseus]